MANETPANFLNDLRKLRRVMLDLDLAHVDRLLFGLPGSKRRRITHNVVVHPLTVLLPTGVGDLLHNRNQAWAFNIDSAADMVLIIHYINYRGVFGVRTITPLENGLRFGTEPPYHNHKTWLLDAFDHDREAHRTFRVDRITQIYSASEPDPIVETV